jgi:hydroxyacyl-ACP dehydratase HTD2-like protein with hotdog domain
MFTGVQNATRNSIGQKVTEILMPQDTKHINETKVKKTGKSQNVFVYDDGDNVTDINEIQNELEIRKTKNIVYKSQKTTKTNKTENSIKTSDNTTVNSPPVTVVTSFSDC